MNSSFPFRPAADTSAAQWVIDGLQGFAESVVSLVPAGFPAYVRVYHPTWHTTSETRTALRWSEVARANNRVAHRQMQWPSIIGSYKLYQSSTLPFLSADSYEHPNEGSLPIEVARSLWQALAPHTTTPDRCWFAVWDGFGDLRPGVQSAPAFDLPHRRLHLFSGAVEAIETSFCGVSDWPRYQSANLWWPDDHAWCVATEIDFVTTYIAGTHEAVTTVVGDTALESDVVEPSDGVSWRSDTVNPPPER